MAASSAKPRSSLQVYISFRGSDVRNNFLGHLYTALDLLTGISPYIDSEELSKGGQIAPLLMSAIEESHAAIIIFSTNFASSRWCLEELAKIMECKEQEPDCVSVRIQRKSYGAAMAKHEDMFGKDSEIVKRWKEALFAAGSLSGWILNDGCEATLIKQIAKEISELKRFDVFLSFRGKDVRENFVKSLNEALVRTGINTFMDSENLVMGQDFPPALKDAIEQSFMYVVVFSENYAESWWCLKELVQILERKNRRKQPMLPIFYQVEPGKVRGQKQSYEEALTKHEIEFGKRKVKKWRDALSEAANVNGMHLRDG
ncbi:hypothetical protein NL676_022891 [Syzygium grande]|nr:hypothetical protein NL676_022891 [Syzygium grande]